VCIISNTYHLKSPNMADEITTTPVEEATEPATPVTEEEATEKKSEDEGTAASAS
jgi:hypothetical protein